MHMKPPIIPRHLDLRAVVEQKSCFLFGPRQTGKSTLIRQQFADCPVWNLLDQTLFLRLSRNPALIRESLADRGGPAIGVIDEIQRMPALLNEVHLLIEEHGVRFLLTGSSARRLRRKGVNLLGGRARSRALHPFLRDRARPSVRPGQGRSNMACCLRSTSPNRRPRTSRATPATISREEVAAEAIVRNIGAFSRFLEVAALAHGDMINFANLANDAQVPASTVREYYRILQDTLIAHEVPAFTDSRKRKAISTSKYYLFDVGLARHLQGRRGLAPGTSEYGMAFESFIFQEIKAWCDHRRLDTPRYWRSKSQFEVDFVFEGLAVEVKAKTHVGARDMRGIKALREEGLCDRLLDRVDGVGGRAGSTTSASCPGPISSIGCGRERGRRPAP